ncbi:related to ubiquitin [Lecanosticta acicola]|uniref:Related to ubiquitin n=1 Tax=Lecanosticta acicola TaxID=111012 RepID=A0AAI8YZI5_9PEZI|nr:related to ubiquitin [Lecanosticta acicola]
MPSDTTPSISSRASSAEPEATMHIFVKSVSGDTFPITIPESTTVGTLRSVLALRTNAPESHLRLVHAGKHMSALSEPLTTYNITRESTLHMALPILGGAPKKIRCNFKDCRDAAQRIVGDCGFCQGHFCGKHRMLESHNCSGLEDCKKEEKDRNREKLESERTVAIKGI